jgi:hypothetical protein
MIRLYNCTLRGTAAKGQTWETKSICEGELDDVYLQARQKSFWELTHGKAVYGSPGLGCNGPYTVTSVEIKLI